MFNDGLSLLPITMDKPLKYFTLITISFVCLIVIIIIATSIPGESDGEAIITIAPDDSLLVKAKKQATQTIDTFESLLKSYPDESFIRFQLNETETHIWGKVEDYNNRQLIVSVVKEDNIIKPVILFDHM